jgi:hypothetical protein
MQGNHHNIKSIALVKKKDRNMQGNHHSIKSIASVKKKDGNMPQYRQN